MISSLERGLRMIELLVENENLTVSESARLMGLNRSVTHRFLATLHNLGYVSQGDRSQYKLSMKLFELGSRVVDHTEIRTIARPFMQSLVEIGNETVNLGMLDRQDIVTIDTLAGKELLNFYSPIGSRWPANTHAMGKAILAFCDLKVQQAYMDPAQIDSQDTNTIADSGTFLAEFEMIRRQGYTIDNEGWAIGLKCVAAPVFDHTNEPTYAVSISGPANRMTPAIIDNLSRDLIQYCRKISERLGSNRN